LELPTSVGFATSAHAECAFIVLQKDFAGLTAVENQVGTRRTAKLLPPTWVRVH